MISSIDTDKPFVKIQHPFEIKGKYLLGKLHREGNILNLIKNIDKETIANIIFDEVLKVFHLLEMRQKCSK